jgi:hypothetical protein
LALDVLEDPFFVLLFVVVDDLFCSFLLFVLELVVFDDPFALDEVFSFLKVSRALYDRPVRPFALDDVVFLDDPFPSSDDGD